MIALLNRNSRYTRTSLIILGIVVGLAFFFGMPDQLVRSSLRLAEHVNVDVAAMNLLDKNYRTHGSGMDAPGRNLFVRLRFRF